MLQLHFTTPKPYVPYVTMYPHFNICDKNLINPLGVLKTL